MGRRKGKAVSTITQSEHLFGGRKKSYQGKAYHKKKKVDRVLFEGRDSKSNDDLGENDTLKRPQITRGEGMITNKGLPLTLIKEEKGEYYPQEKGSVQGELFVSL